MRTTLKFSLMLMFSYFIACAPVKLDELPDASCGAGVVCVKSCSGDSCVKDITYTRKIGETPVDILIVNDNSGSMSTVHSRFATAFGGFLNNLENAGLDYRIAMTTTDISNDPNHGSLRFGHEFNSSASNGPSLINKYGALQDGNLIDFDDGVSFHKYITNSMANRNQMFMNAVKRPETVYCENSGFLVSQCPSSDERGIFAMNLVLDRTASQFVRPSSALAVVILANEDERGVSSLNPANDASALYIKNNFPMTPYDEPEAFVTRFRSTYPGKTLGVHSIIVKPGDTACRNSVSDPARNIIAREGYAYANLSQRTGGTVGSICETSYASQLQAIGNNIQQQALALPLSCRPVGDKFTVTVSPNQTVNWTPDWTSMQLKADRALPANTEITLTYSCQL